MASVNTLVVRLKNLEKIDVNKALTESCLLVESDAKQLVPVDTGRLKSSIQSKVEGDTGTVGTNVEYAPYVEFGTGLYSSLGNGRTQVPWRYQDAKGQWHTTSGNQPQPFLGPALNMNKDKIKKIFRKAIKEVMK